jgi:hypothetical protein
MTGGMFDGIGTVVIFYAIVLLGIGFVLGLLIF